MGEAKFKVGQTVGIIEGVFNNHPNATAIIDEVLIDQPGSEIGYLATPDFFSRTVAFMEHQLRELAPPSAAASDDAPSRERLAAITARVAEYERQMKTRLSDADISPMDAEEAADMLGGLAYIKSEQIAALESALAAAESDRARLAAALEPFVDAAVQDDKRVAMGHIHDVSAINDVEYVDIRFVDERRNFSEYRLKKQSLANVLQAAANLRKQTPTATADAANALADGGE